MALSASQKAAASKTLAKAKAQLTKLNKDFNAGKKSNGGKGYSQEFLSSATDKLKSANKTASSISKNLSRRPITPEDMSVDPGVVEMPKPVVPVNQGLDLSFNNSLVAPNGMKDNMLEVMPFNASEGAGDNEQAAADSVNALAPYIQQFLNVGKPEEGANENALVDARRQAGVDAAQREFNRYSQQLNAITAKRDADILSLEGQGRGITDVIIGGQQAKINREAAIQALPVQAQLAAAQGNLEQANALMGQLYQAKQADIQADLTYRTNLANSVMQFATSAQQSILQGRIADNQQRAAIAQSNLSFQRQLSLQALEFGQNGLIGGIASLDPNSPTFEQDIAAYTAQLRKPVAAGSAQAPEVKNFGTSDNPIWKQFNPGTGAWEDVAGLGGASTPQQAASLIQATKQLDTLNAITSSKAVDSTVGTTIFSRGAGNIKGAIGRLFAGGATGAAAGAAAGAPFAGIGAIPGAIGGAVLGGTAALLQGSKDSVTGDRQALIADVQNMTTNLSFDKLIQTKAQGATYGSLTEGEWRKIDAAATKLGTWAITDDNGNVIGYNTSEKNFKKEIDTIKYYTKLDYVLKGGDPSLVGAVQQSDGTYWVQNSDGSYSQLQLEY